MKKRLKFDTIRGMLLHFGYTVGIGDNPMLFKTRKVSYGDYVIHTKGNTTYFRVLHSIRELKMGGLAAMNVSEKSPGSVRRFIEIIQSLTKCGVEKMMIGGKLYVVIIRKENRI